MKKILRYCCDNCFSDEEICNIIQSFGKIGDCDFCGSQNCYVYDFKNNSELTEVLNELLELYSEKEDLPDNFPTKKLSIISDALKNNWNIFNVKSEVVYELITNICKDKYSNHKNLFLNSVGMAHVVNEKFLEENSILGNSIWESFVEEIKHKSRFHTSIINLGILDSFLSVIIKLYTPSTMFYRTRISDSSAGYAKENMGAPPVKLATAGRANAEGISYLYLSTNTDTTIHEIKAFLYDYVTVGTFKPVEELRIIDLTNLNNISPFILSQLPKNNISLSQFSVNLETVEKISNEISKPLRRIDSTLDYLPTQFICDYIRSKGYDGIEYKSTVDSKGKNLAIFDSNKFICTQADVYEIDKIMYDYKPIQK